MGLTLLSKGLLELNKGIRSLLLVASGKLAQNV